MIRLKTGQFIPPGQRSRCLYKCRIFWIPYGRKGWTPPCLRRCRNTAPPIRSARRCARVSPPLPLSTTAKRCGSRRWRLSSAAKTGGKATGKNVLAENLAAAFGRPAWDISFHVNMDAASLIGMDTFAGGQVVFRPGPVYRCAQCGGFGVLDEINMAKNEALAVLHAVLDFRRAIDVPGYDRIPLAEETRFIATMNYGYAGTRELNEALTSRFAVVQMPTITQDNLEKLLRAQFPDLAAKYVHQFALLFLDLQKKCDSAEISTKALDLRGMLDALRLIRRGIPAGAALDMGITNKAFDSYEQGLIRDVIAARIPAKLDAGKLFA